MSLVVETRKEVLREEGVNWEGECCALHSAQLYRKNMAGAEKKGKRWRGWQVISMYITLR